MPQHQEMQLSDSFLNAIDILRSPTDTWEMAEIHNENNADANTNNNTFSRAIKSGYCSDEVAKTLYDYYAAKAHKLKSVIDSEVFEAAISPK